MNFPPEVERWRSLVAKYFPAELVDKALWTIQGESGGNPGSVGDGGAARGLFQIQDSRNFSSRPDAAYLDDPERNIAYAAQKLGGASGNFSAWGDGTAGQAPYDPATGKGRFGALGNNPFPGDGGGSVSAAGGGRFGARVGSVPPDSGGGGTSNMAYDPQMEQQLRLAAAAAWARVIDGDPTAQDDWLKVQTALDYYTKHGSFDSSEEDAAQRAFDNAIKLGDFKAGEAAQAYGRWKDKRDAAKGLAEGQISAANSRNEMNASLAGKRFQNSPEPETRTYFAPSYDDAFAKWKSQLGVGGEPSAESSSYSGPSLPQSTLRTGGSSGGGSSSGASFDAPVPSDAQTAGRFTLNNGAANERAGGGQSLFNKVFYGNDGKFFGIGGLDDLKPEMPSSYNDWLLGNDHKFFGVDIGESRMPEYLGNAGGAIGNVAGGAKKKLKKFGKLIGLKDGGRNVPEGVYQVGEQGLEHAITPDGQLHQLGVQGPEIAMLPQGTDVLPANVPPEQAIMMAKLRQLLAEEQGQGPGRQLAEQQARANDPELQQKVLASLQRAIGAHDAMNPPATPMLTGNGWKSDPWADWRQLTGVGPDGQPLAAAQGVA